MKVDCKVRRYFVFVAAHENSIRRHESDRERPEWRKLLDEPSDLGHRSYRWIQCRTHEFTYSRAAESASERGGTTRRATSRFSSAIQRPGGARKRHARERVIGSWRPALGCVIGPDALCVAWRQTRDAPFSGSSCSLGSGGYEHQVVDKLTTLRMMRGAVMLP
jgi:hypothetical protein